MFITDIDKFFLIVILIALGAFLLCNGTIILIARLVGGYKAAGCAMFAIFVFTAAWWTK